MSKASKRIARKPTVKSRIAAKTKAEKPAAPKPRGFAAMTVEERTKIARMGGEAVSADRYYMAEIGARGGENSHGVGGR